MKTPKPKKLTRWMYAMRYVGTSRWITAHHQTRKRCVQDMKLNTFGRDEQQVRLVVRGPFKVVIHV